MTVSQSHGSAGFSQDRRDSTSGIDTFKGEGGAQRRQPATGERSDFRQDAELAVQSAKDALGNVRDMAGDVYASAKKGATDAAGTFNDTVVRNPWTSVGIAAGAGLLLGLLLARVRS